MVMKRIALWMVLTAAASACAGGDDGWQSDPVIVASNLPACDSIVEGVELTEDFQGCMIDEEAWSLVLRAHDCDDGRQLINVGTEGEPWRGHAFLPGPFLSWEVHGDEPWNECKGYD